MPPPETTVPTAPLATAAGSVTVCIATYRRPTQLTQVLDDLERQSRLPDEVVIVDNDADGSAQALVATRQHHSRILRWHYHCEPRQNVALARNAALDRATSDWVAWIDDDERAPATWLAQLLSTAAQYPATAVMGPVIAVLPCHTAPWLRRARLFDWPRHASGTAVPANELRIGNLLMDRQWVEREALRFDPAYGLTGGEDGNFLLRIVARGGRIVACNEAEVTEPIPEYRLALRWQWWRAWRGGQDFQRHTWAGLYGPIGPAGRIAFLGRAAAQAAAAAALALLTLPLGRHHAWRWTLRCSANLGKLAAVAGRLHHEYARPDGRA